MRRLCVITGLLLFFSSSHLYALNYLMDFTLDGERVPETDDTVVWSVSFGKGTNGDIFFNVIAVHFTGRFFSTYPITTKQIVNTGGETYTIIADGEGGWEMAISATFSDDFQQIIDLSASQKGSNQHRRKYKLNKTQRYVKLPSVYNRGCDNVTEIGGDKQ